MTRSMQAFGGFWVDSKNLGMLGLSPEEAQQFLRDLEAINAQYQPRISAELDAVSQANADYRDEFGFYDPRDPFYQPPKIEVSKALTDEYAQAFFGLTNRYGINPVIEGTDKVYYLDPGIQGINPYGPQAQFNDPIGTRPGMFTRDARTEGDFSWRNAVPAALKALVNPLNYIPIPGIGGSDSVGVPWITAGREGIEGGLDTNYGVGEDIQSVLDHVAQFADSQGNPVGTVDLPEHPLETVADTIGGLLGGPENIFGPQITIPGLPFPIPGTMTWQDLWEMAQDAGKSIWEVLTDMLDPSGADGGNTGGSGGADGGEDYDEDEDPPIVIVPEEEEDPPAAPDAPPVNPVAPDDGGFVTPGFGGGDYEEWQPDPVTPPLQGTPPAQEAPAFEGSEPSQPGLGTTPGQPGFDGGPNGDGTRPGFQPSDPREPGLLDDTTDDPVTPPLNPADPSGGVTFPTFIPEEDPPQPTLADFTLWDYIGPDTSWGVETPDYGSPELLPLFDFQRQPSQPTPVAPDPQPRTPFLTPAQLARERQGTIADMIRRGLL